MPADLKRRLGLDDGRSWIICDEVNRFIWPGYDLRPIPGGGPGNWEYGMLPKGLYEKAKTLFLKCRKEGLLKSTDRS